ncbi:Cardiolipin synthase C [Pseudidiomarina piscicola]|uniref:Cardiolipin synthase C n=1 Tax=Pseudidiomarina piscicola TaxID=2614830 RepID=A0A6S6WKE6_9GAMM|nr:phospholipase D family protein [Pseudidiomarina piscicola]CAB0150183.1 Cardiolipin synthase C [Pseudidiomarina piscicola]VZT39622.1 Cardiolipin synthase C [Pseudomonas aeruginosa]
MKDGKAQGRLAQAVAPLQAEHQGHSGTVPLVDAREAFAARVTLARQAEYQLDLQYYIWRKDITGTLLFEELHEAADRGVKVRLLLDDHNTAGLDALLIGLQQHPNIEVRLFNPLKLRRPRFLNYLFDFRRVNRRMHNKCFIADGSVVISGGRNIGDEYFGATSDILFADLDALLIGPVVEAVQNDFERYWTSTSAVPLDKLFTLTKPQELSALKQVAARYKQNPKAQAYVKAIDELPFVQQLQRQEIKVYWSETQLVSDSPAKALGRARPQQMIPHQLQQAIGTPQSHVTLVSPYFVPTKNGVKELIAMAKRGVQIIILTNSLAATDVAVVHAGYAKWRRKLLRHGIQLFELQKLSPLARRQQRKERRQRLKGKERFGSSASSLHAKTFMVDLTRVFVGSLNFDPRSAAINTELGFVMHSRDLALKIEQAIVQTLPHYAYQLRLIKNKVVWVERLGKQRTYYRSEPGASIWRRLAVRILERLPIERLL